MDKIEKILLTYGNLSEDILKEYDEKYKNLDVFSYLVQYKNLSETLLTNFIVSHIKNGNLTVKDIYDHFPKEIASKIFKVLAAELKIEYIDLETKDVDLRISSKVPINQLNKIEAIPISDNGVELVVVVSNPLNLQAIDIISRYFPNKQIQRVMAPSTQIRSLLDKLTLRENIKHIVSQIRKEISLNNANNAVNNDATAIMSLINLILTTSIKQKASDIHIEPTDNNCIVRARIDGILNEIFIFDQDIYAPLSSRLKLLANLDIAEKRKPQDGRFSAPVAQKEYDFRISTLPIANGESIVMRILDKTKAMIKLEDAGMSKYNYKKFTQNLQNPYGIILVTGPTGSGKSTTLYGALNMLRGVERKIITVEDPIEYKINLVQQSQVQPKIGYTFAEALRSILRQDPDVIMVGEIRDKETLSIAIQAASTGHLVLSTLHTNDAVSSIARMIDMGIEPYLISGALIGVEAQRLVRKICPHCKAPIKLPADTIKRLKPYLPEKYNFFQGKGCKHCNMTGYSGRELISEVFSVDETLASMIAKNEPKEHLQKYLIENQNFVTLFQDGVNKALEGSTTIDEVLRVTKV